MELLRKLNLSGNLYYNYVGDTGEGDYGFYLGPETIDNCLSDDINITGYLFKIYKLLSLNVDLDLAENFHAITAENEEEALKSLKLLISSIENDGLKINVYNDKGQRQL